MDADSSTCPQDSNSTDCLLRNIISLLDNGQQADDAKFDWDPLTFIFTLIIGVVALIFALIPIIQVIIAPGQGSRTTSYLAIGKKWSRKRERRWNWHEWTFEYTASTPIFRVETLEHWIEQDINVNTKFAGYEAQTPCHVNVTTRDGNENPDLEKLAMNTTGEVKNNAEHNSDDIKSALVTILHAILPWRMPSSRSKETTAATWIDFFQKVGLDKIEPRDEMGTRRVTADYLPSDLVAAPAYAQIGVIVTAASTTAGGATWTINKQSEYPVILGSGFQFDFRQHPILGVLGAYWQYRKANKDAEDSRPGLGVLAANWLYSKTSRGKEASSQGNLEQASRTVCSLSQLRVAMLHARGTIEVDRQSLFQSAPLARGNDSSVAVMNLLNGQHRVQTLKFMLAVSKKQMNAWIQESFILDYGELSQEQYMPVVGLFLASTPRHVPALFPTDMLSKKPPLTTLALNGHYWTEVTSGDVRGDDMSDWPLSLKDPSWGGVEWLNVGMSEIGLINGKDQDKYLKLAREDINKRLYRSEGETSKPMIFRIVLHLCLKMLHNGDTFRTWFVDYSPEVRFYLRYLTLLQLRMLDRWFLGPTSDQPRAHIESRAILICNTTIVFMLAANIASEKEDPIYSTSGTRKGNIWSHNSRTIRWLDDFLKSLGLAEDTLATARGTWNIQRSCDRKNLSISAADDPTRNVSDDSEETSAPLASQWKPFDAELKRLACTVYNKNWELFNTHQLLNRLAKVVELGLDQTYRKRRPAQVAGEDQSTKTIDDLIIYRCILVAMLFQTAPDNSELRRTGLWEQVVAII